ncbi:MAG: glycosyltransferase family 2 protein [Cyclobacteriaceae bacterium]|nr:glycosyltransferase family 2 protein [Cyclobacteriaceae bacterium]MDH4298718.1 glycosyltransferase family 2 protein [Cyclobacteriaceae bacterium]MDH5248586.1 glycosyltransferase family 2 protein [Cyclobacteriaceae bacterium]
MTISGFTFVRNATKLYYPVKASIESILPIVDEFIIAIAEGDPDDRTREVIESIGSDKIRFIETVWDLNKYPNGLEYAHQTDIAKDACRGDWLFYLQCDEAIHEKYLPAVVANCKKFLDDAEVNGFLFRYKHFYGDFWHYHISHDWYPKEIRVIRNLPNIHSWRDAQSFRHIPDFDGVDYFSKKGTTKVDVVAIDAEIFHYGFVRPPELMAKKNRNVSISYNVPPGKERGYSRQLDIFDYGPLDRLQQYTDTHPAVMDEWITQFNWKDQLQYEGRRNRSRQKHEHETFKDRLLTFIEQNLLGGRLIGGFKNYNLLKGK